MGTAAGERRRRVNLADAENCVEGYFHFGARAEGFLALARREKKKKKEVWCLAFLRRRDIQKDAIASAISRIHFKISSQSWLLKSLMTTG